MQKDELPPWGHISFLQVLFYAPNVLPLSSLMKLTAHLSSPLTWPLFGASPMHLSCVDPRGLSWEFPLCPAPPCPQRMFTWHCSIGVGSCVNIVEHCDFKEEGFRQERMMSRGSPVRTGQGIFKPNFQQILARQMVSGEQHSAEIWE